MSPVPSVAIGERDVLVSIEQATEAIAPTGFAVETFTPLAPPTWMRRATLPQAGRGEPFVADQVVERVVLRWRMPYRPDMDPERVDVVKLRRLIYAGKTHDILEATLIGRREQIELVTRVSQ